MLDFFSLDAHAPSSSAFSRQRAKLKSEALEAVFHNFNSSVQSMQKTSCYKFFAADGSTFTFFSKPVFSPSEYHVCEGHSQKGFYSIHLNTFYDLQKHTYSDALFQPVHQKDEFAAFCKMLERHDVSFHTKAIFIGDRGYCSYNNMAHVLEKRQYFLFRTTDIHSKGLVGNFDFPEEASFDIRINVTLVRSHKRRSSLKMDFTDALLMQMLPLIILNMAHRTPMTYRSGLSVFPYQKLLTNVSLPISQKMNSQWNK